MSTDSAARLPAGPFRPGRLPPVSRLLIPVLLAVSGCVTYEEAPLDAEAILLELDRRTWDSGGGDAAARATPRQFAAFAVSRNPVLEAARRELGVGEALLVQAGLLPDPLLGWDAMDLLASQIVEGRSGAVDVLSGLQLELPLLRPGERDARVGVARWRLEEARARVLEAEWRLTSAVLVAAENLAEARQLLARSSELLEIAGHTRDWFQRAREAGAATAIQARIAELDLLAIEADRIRLEARERQDRQRLAALLGLPPEADLPEPDLEEVRSPGGTLQDLVEEALDRRPDLLALRAAYQAAEEGLRLEIARQFPLLAVGTGFSFIPGILSRFNRPAIDAALARRATMQASFQAQVHEVRREIHDAWAALEEARREQSFMDSRLLTTAEDGLELARQAFEAGEATVLETLNLQRSVVDARIRATQARAELRRRQWLLLAATGWLPVLLPPPEMAEIPDDDLQPGVRQ